MSGFMKPGMLVWTNVRRGDDWWARLVDASMASFLGYPPDEVDDEEGLPFIRNTRRLALASSSASSVPAGNEPNYQADRDEVSATTGIRTSNAD